MKANEIEDGKVLMIGNLVIGCIETDIVGEATYKIPCKVTDINHYGDVICEPLKSFPDELDWQDGDDYSWIEAIPLTSEILEKNGFEVQDQGGGRKDVWTGFGIDCEGDIEVEFQNNIPVHLKIDGVFKGEYYTSTNIKYIHQLQHILRLCGIEKTIEI